MRSFTVIIFNLVLLQSTIILLVTADHHCQNVSCEWYCPYGNIFDKGCRTCSCHDPCADIPPCPSDEECKVESLACIQQPCGFKGKCGPVPVCPMNICVPPYCPYGIEYDQRGCPPCQCVDHCKNKVCDPEETCVIEYISYSPTGGIRPKCIKKCPNLPLPCHSKICEYGFKLDCNNCPTCECNNPCEEVICTNDKYCVVQQIVCINDPCPPVSAICEPYCPDGRSAFIGINHFPLECSAGDWTCPIGFDCIKVNNLNQSYCCSQGRA